MSLKSLISFTVLVLVVGCGKKDNGDDSNNAPVAVAESEDLVTVAKCHQPDDSQQLLMIAKTKDDAPVSPNSNSILIFFLKNNNPSNEKRLAYPVTLKESDASISIEGVDWAQDMGISATIDLATGKGTYKDSLQSFDLDCKMPAAK